jgi:hypothetical protein
VPSSISFDFNQGGRSLGVSAGRNPYQR